MIRRLSCAGLALVAVSFAVLQYNDPDPAIWVGLYGAAAAALIAAALGLPSRGLCVATLLASLILAAISVPGVLEYLSNADGMTLAHAMSEEYPYLEETREFGGALIAFGMALLAWPWRAGHASTQAPD